MKLKNIMNNTNNANNINNNSCFFTSLSFSKINSNKKIYYPNRNVIQLHTSTCYLSDINAKTIELRTVIEKCKVLGIEKWHIIEVKLNYTVPKEHLLYEENPWIYTSLINYNTLLNPSGIFIKFLVEKNNK